MKAPKCPLCGADHWSRQPHVWNGGSKAADAALDAATAEPPREAGEVREKIRKAGVAMVSEPLAPPKPAAEPTARARRKAKQAPSNKAKRKASK